MCEYQHKQISNIDNISIDELPGKFGNLKVGPGGDAEGSFEIVDTIGQSAEASESGIKLFQDLHFSLKRVNCYRPLHIFLCVQNQCLHHQPRKNLKRSKSGERNRRRVLRRKVTEIVNFITKM